VGGRLRAARDAAKRRIRISYCAAADPAGCTLHKATSALRASVERPSERPGVR